MSSQNTIKRPMLYRMKDLPDIVGMSRAEIYRQMKRGDFPKPVSLGGKSVAWKTEDLERWKSELHPI